jgi:hypothetical protein
LGRFFVGYYDARKVVYTLNVIQVGFPDSIRKDTSKSGFILLLLHYGSDDVFRETFH